MEVIKVDARGLSCPEPVLLTMNALKEKAECYEVLVDKQTAAGNITRFVKHAGKSIEVTEQGPDFLLTIK